MRVSAVRATACVWPESRSKRQGPRFPQARRRARGGCWVDSGPAIGGRQVGTRQVTAGFQAGRLLCIFSPMFTWDHIRERLLRLVQAASLPLLLCLPANAPAGTLAGAY